MTSSLAVIGKVRRLQKLKEQIQKERRAKALEAEEAASYRARAAAEASTQATIDEALKDFDKFASLVDIITKDKRRIRFKPNRVQWKYLRGRSARDVILKARQQGFTTIEQIRDLFYFLTVPGARVVVVCQSVTDNGPLKELTERFRVMFESLKHAGMKLDFTTEATGHWILAERHSSLKVIVAGASEASASKKGRAGTINRLHVTEAAFFEFADDTLNALLECVPDPSMGSEIVIESTANGSSGFFHKLCKTAEAKRGSFKFHFFAWYETDEYRTALEPGEVIQVDEKDEREKALVAHGVSLEQLKWIRAKIADKGQDNTDQEYPSDPETCFLVSGRQFFDRKATTNLLQWVREPEGLREKDCLAVWHKPQPGRLYLIASDTSEGTGADASAAVVRDYLTNELCARLHGQFTPWQLAEQLAALGWEYNQAFIIVERNNHGHSVLQALSKLRDEKDEPRPYTNIYYAEDEKPGWNTTGVTRPVMLDGLEAAHRKGEWTTPDKVTLGQVRNFVIAKSGKAQAAAGEHDDLVLAEAILWEVRSRIPKPEEVEQGHGTYQRGAW